MTTITDDLPNVPDDLELLTDQWHLWPGYSQGAGPALIRRLDEHRYVAVVPFLFTYGVVWGWLDELRYFEDRWCYHDLTAAVAAATVWNGEQEPDGWHRHPLTGRRRPGGDKTQEYINP